MSAAPWVTKPMEKFQTFLNLLLNHGKALGYGLVTLLTAGGERIFSTVVFQCPCSATWNLPYGLMFLLAPALVLFLLGYMLSPRIWRLLTGCCSSTSGSSESNASTCCGSGTSGVLLFLEVSGAAALAPLTWVAVALLGGSFYECAASGSAVLGRRLCKNLNTTSNATCTTELPLVPCQKSKAAEVQGILQDLKAQSQILGWTVIASLIIIVLIISCVTRCTSKVSFFQLKFHNAYLKQELKILKAQSTERATELATGNVQCFFEGSSPNIYKIPSREQWQKISSIETTVDSSDEYYTSLHKYVSTGGESPSEA